jgi:predicted nucleotidyltransferase
MKPSIKMDHERIADFCRKWEIVELALFGSVLRDDFGAESDVDVLVKFSTQADWSLLDHVRMEADLSEIVERKVDLVSYRGLERSPNWIRRKSILESAQVLYAA